jgi:hypothetical protein
MPVWVQRPARQLAPLHVADVVTTVEGESRFVTHIGLCGKPYALPFNDLMNLILNRCGRTQARLEHKK